MYGSNDTKLNARIEAVRLAAMVKDVNIENVVEVSKKIADFIIGEANIPEANDKGDIFEKMMERMMEQNKLTAESLNNVPATPTKLDTVAE